MASPDIPMHLDDLLIPAENYFKFTFFIMSQYIEFDFPGISHFRFDV